MEITEKNDLIRTILSMPPMDRIEIVDKIFEGFDLENSTKNDHFWAEESEKRIDAYLDGSNPIISSEDVFKRINQQA